MRTVAALFVQPKGTYSTIPGVELWDEVRDARTYAGPHSVVAHPPCGRWCRLAGLVEKRWGHKKGDDGGCFRSALASVRRWGGVLEHPAWTDAWAAHDLVPPNGCGWQRTLSGEWVCQVSQAAYGCRAPKETWLLLVSDSPPPALDWTRPPTDAVISGTKNRCSTEKRVWSREASSTPPRFAEMLIELAREARPE